MFICLLLDLLFIAICLCCLEQFCSASHASPTFVIPPIKQEINVGKKLHTAFHHSINVKHFNGIKWVLQYWLAREKEISMAPLVPHPDPTARTENRSQVQIF